jgi:hypothetical protein
MISHTETKTEIEFESKTTITPLFLLLLGFCPDSAVLVQERVPLTERKTPGLDSHWPIALSLKTINSFFK